MKTDEKANGTMFKYGFGVVGMSENNITDPRL